MGSGSAGSIKLCRVPLSAKGFPDRAPQVAPWPEWLGDNRLPWSRPRARLNRNRLRYEGPAKRACHCSSGRTALTKRLARPGAACVHQRLSSNSTSAFVGGR